MNQNIDIAIIGAIHEEVNALLGHMSGYQRFEHMQFVYYRGQLAHKEVMVVLSGLGKVNAALATNFVIERFSPQYLINIGSAGGLAQTLSVGDVVVSSAVFYHDVDATLLGCAYGQLPDMPAQFQADSHLVALAEKALASATNLQFTKGSIASGDAFVSDAAQIRLIQQRFPDTAAVDMEAAAIAHICHLYQVPFVVTRAISDLVGNHDNHVDFFSFLKQASVNSANTVECMIGLI